MMSSVSGCVMRSLSFASVTARHSPRRGSFSQGGAEASLHTGPTRGAVDQQRPPQSLDAFTHAAQTQPAVALSEVEAAPVILNPQRQCLRLIGDETDVYRRAATLPRDARARLLRHTQQPPLSPH